MTTLRRARPCLCGGRASAFGTSLSSASTSLCSRFPNFFRSVASIRRNRLGLVVLRFLAPRNVFALIDPALYANHAVSGVCFGGAEINVRAQRLQRQTALQIPLLARDFCAIQAAGDSHLDPLAAETKSRVHALAHRAAKRHALFELQRY